MDIKQITTEQDLNLLLHYVMEHEILGFTKLSVWSRSYVHGKENQVCWETPAEMAKGLGVHRSYIYRMLSQLEAEGFIKKHYPNASKSYGLITCCPNWIWERVKDWLHDMSPEKRELVLDDYEGWSQEQLG